MTASKIYHSREDRIKELHADEERVQYDEADKGRIESLASVVTDYTTLFLNSLGMYRKELDEPIDEDSESRMGYARRDLIEKWAMMQGAVSKAAWTFRFDGNSAFEKMIESAKTDAAMDMRGL